MRDIPKTRRLVSPGDAGVSSVDAIPRGASAEVIAEAIRSGLCPDDASFDLFMSRELRRLSGRHWTPLAVALRVAEWLDGAGVGNVVDLGSGGGKFCVVAALASKCSFIGIERRPRFVEAANLLARVFRVDDRVQFVHGTLSRRTIPAADAYYLYNPFGENLFGPGEHLDDDVELSPQRYERDIALVETFFDRAPVGTIVVDYNGFGGRMPGSYQEVVVDREMPDLLRMWRKGPAHDETHASMPAGSTGRHPG